MLAAEAAPLIKVGGLADVMGALPGALRERGHSPVLVIPHYGKVDDQRHKVTAGFTVNVPWGPWIETAHVAEATIGEVPVYLVSGGPLVRNQQVYGTTVENDGPRFSFVARAALLLAEMLDFQPDILHIHDHHPGLAVYWLAIEGRKSPFWQQTASVVTVHNLPFQGNHAEKTLALMRLPPAGRESGLPWWARSSLMGLALAYADKINAVSPGYAQEMLTEDYGAGLHTFLQTRRDKLSGILNGLDYDLWNPATDTALPQPFDVETLAMRAVNKQALQMAVNLPASDGPVLGVVSRLDHQKGFDLVVPALESLLVQSEAQVVVLGTGMPEIQAGFEQLMANFPAQVAFVNQFDGKLARLIYAGSDMFLMPSRYEPCGTGQMVALRYGSVPIVRATGGLRDTVIDVDIFPESGVGFVFESFTAEALLQTIQRALRLWKHPARWQAVQRRGMALRFSWARAAASYNALYSQALVALAKLQGRGGGASDEDEGDDSDGDATGDS